MGGPQDFSFLSGLRSAHPVCMPGSDDMAVKYSTYTVYRYWADRMCVTCLTPRKAGHLPGLGRRERFRGFTSSCIRRERHVTDAMGKNATMVKKLERKRRNVSRTRNFTNFEV